MKKIALFLLVIAAVLLTAVYTLIPANENFSYSAQLNCTENGAIRVLHSQKKWKEWWPGTALNDSSFSFADLQFVPGKLTLPGFETSVINGTDTAAANFFVQGVGLDSAFFGWSATFQYSSNPFARIADYFRIMKMKKGLQQFITAIKPYFEQQKNIYGMNVIQEKVKDSSLISLKKSFDHYPSTPDIYAMINTLKDYVKQQKGEQSNPPMLNVFQTSTTSYEVMVAVPTRWDLPQTENFKLKKMVLGNVLTGEVTGGVATVAEAEKQMADYATDHRKSSPAIPFQSLVTDRMLETDTSKWVTRLYYPIFY